MSQLSQDAQDLLQILPASGRVTNQTGMKLTAWDYDRLIKAKFELRDAGFVEIKAGWGGPFGRIVAPQTITAGPTARASLESELYKPLQRWIEAEFTPDDFDDQKDYFEVTVSANRRPPSAGQWEVPDLLSVSLKKYPFVPRVLMETCSFEVKLEGSAFSIGSIFETISHSKFVHRAYYCFEATDLNFENRADYQRIFTEAEVHGIGLLTLRYADDLKTAISVRELLPAKLLEPDASNINWLIESFFDPPSKQRILQRTGFSITW